MKKTTQSRAGRRRWAELIRFLKTTMLTAKSEKVRMSAALRLASILELREQRELLEIKAAIRASEKESTPAPAQPEPTNTPDEAQLAEDQKRAEVWSNILNLNKGRSNAG
jgi:hypothetical protein